MIAETAPLFKAVKSDEVELAKFIADAEKTGLPVIKFHRLRHTNVTLLLTQNMDIAIIARSFTNNYNTRLLCSSYCIT